MRNDSNLQWRAGKRVAVIGAGPGGISAALALHRQGFDVRVYERQPEPKPLGGAVLLSVPVLAVLRHYGVDLNNFGSFTVTEFRNNRNRLRSRLPFNRSVEESFGINGWHYGMLRSNAFARMLELMPDRMLVPDSEFDHYTQRADGVTVNFKDGKAIDADILVGADGVRSGVSRQLFGDPQLFHVGLRVWLAWCDPVEGIAPQTGRIVHSHKYQASFFPMLHDGKPGYEWWVVEPCRENAPAPSDVAGHLGRILRDFPDPLPRLLRSTDVETRIFKWDIYNRPSLQHWSEGRVVCLGDAVHPVSPYAAYGMGMAIEDGYFLGKALVGADLVDAGQISASLRQFEAQRVAYVNHHVELARKLGHVFHRLPYPLAKLRDLVFDHTGFLDRMIRRDYLADAEKMSLMMQELHQA